jgi:RHS repeat-associated protein
MNRRYLRLGIAVITVTAGIVSTDRTIWSAPQAQADPVKVDAANQTQSTEKARPIPAVVPGNPVSFEQPIESPKGTGPTTWTGKTDAVTVAAARSAKPVEPSPAPTAVEGTRSRADIDAAETEAAKLRPNVGVSSAADQVDDPEPVDVFQPKPKTSRPVIANKSAKAGTGAAVVAASPRLTQSSYTPPLPPTTLKAASPANSKFIGVSTAPIVDAKASTNGHFTAMAGVNSVELSDLDDPAGTVQLKIGTDVIGLRPIGSGARARPAPGSQRTATKEKTRVRWAKAFADGSDLVEQPVANGTKGAIVLSSPPTGEPIWEFELVLPNGFVPMLGDGAAVPDSLRVAGRSIRIKDLAGDIVAEIPSGTTQDASGAQTSNDLTLRSAKNGRWIISIATDKAWLTAPDRKYPVEVDPSVNFWGATPLTWTNATSVNGWVSSLNGYNSETIAFNYYASGTRKFMTKFDLSTLQGDSRLVTSATVNGHVINCDDDFSAGYGYSYPLKISALAGAYGSNAAEPGNVANSSTWVYPSGLDTPIYFDVTAMVQNWNSGAWTNYGIGLETYAGGAAHYCNVIISGLSINYTPNAKPVAVTTALTPADNAQNILTTPTFTADATDADPTDTLKFYFEVCTPSFAAATACQNSGWTLTKTYTPPNALTFASPGQWRVSVSDGKLEPELARRSFTVQPRPNGAPQNLQVVSPPLNSTGQSLRPTFVVTADDPNSDPLEFYFYVWTNTQAWQSPGFLPASANNPRQGSWTLPVDLAYGTTYNWMFWVQDRPPANAQPSVSTSTGVVYLLTTLLRPNTSPNVPVPDSAALAPGVAQPFVIHATATDPDGDGTLVEYKICPTDGTACRPESGFLNGSYSVTGLSYNKAYTWQAHARDVPPSTSQSAITSNVYSSPIPFTTGPDPSVVSAQTIAPKGTDAVPGGISNRPILQAQASDLNGGSLEYFFEICANDFVVGAQCFTSGVGTWRSLPHWQVPGQLDWNVKYKWRARVRRVAGAINDNVGTLTNEESVLVNVPTVDDPSLGAVGFNPYVEIDTGEDEGGVNEAVGQLTYSHTDVSLPSVTGALQVTRVYNERARRTGLFGRGWSSNLDARIVYKTNSGALPSLNDPVQVILPDGRREYFSRNQNGTFVSASLGFKNDLVRDPTTNIFTYVLRDRSKLIFNVNGRLERFEDRNGNALNYSYQATGELATITDAKSGRSLSFSIVGGRLTAVTTSLVVPGSSASALTTSYIYVNDQLDTVTPPSTATIAGTWTYQYSAGRLSKVIKPFGNADFEVGYDNQGFVLGAPNIAIDPSMEDATSGWSATASSSAVAPATTQVLFGAKALKGTFVATKPIEMISAPIAVEASKTYTVSGFVKGAAANSGLVVPYWQGLDDNQVPIVDPSPTTGYIAGGSALVEQGDNGYPTMSSAWVPVRGSFRTPENVKYVRLSFKWAIPTADVFLDGVMLTKGDGLTNRVAWRKDGKGAQTTFAYAWNGANTEVTTLDPRPAVPPAGQFLSKSVYNDKYQLITQIDPKGRTTSFEFYPATGFIWKRTDPLNRVTEFTQDARGNMTSEKKVWINRSQYWTYKVDLSGKGTDLVETFRDARSASATDNTYLTQYVYDNAGNMIKQIDPAGAITTMVYTVAGDVAVGTGATPIGLLKSTSDRSGKVVNYGYDSRGDLYRIDDPAGGISVFSTDGIGRVLTAARVDGVAEVGKVSNAFDVRSRLVSSTSAAIPNSITAVTHQLKTVNAYDANDNLLTVTTSDLATTGADPTRIVTTDYDANDRAVKITQTNGATPRVSEFFYDEVGNQIETINPNLVRRKTTFDERNLPTSISLPGYYDAPGGTTRNVTTSTTTYDVLGRVDQRTDLVTDVSPVSSQTTKYAYWDDDRVRSVTRVGYVDLTGVTRNTEIASFTYDAIGNVSTETHGPQSILNEYDTRGFLWKRTVAPGTIGRTTTFGLDAEGRVQSATTGRFIQTATYHPASKLVQSKTTSGLGAVESYTYDVFGRLKEATSSRTFKTTYTYDIADRVIKIESPTTSVWTAAATVATQARPTVQYGYNTFGEQSNLKDERLNQTTTAFNVLGQVAGITYPIDGVLTPTETFGYDAAGNRTSVIDRRGQTTNWTYDALGRARTQLDPAATVGGVRPATTFKINIGGQTEESIDPNGVTSRSTFDLLGRQRTSSLIERQINPAAAAVPITSTFDYDDANNMTMRQNPNGSKAFTSYNKAGQVETRTDETGVVSTYTYDLSTGWLLTTAIANTHTIKNSYDDAGRTTQTDMLAADNVTAVATDKWTYDSESRPLTHTRPNTGSGVPTDRTEYDELGRLAKSFTQTDFLAIPTMSKTEARYDAAGNAVQIIDPLGRVTTSTYNAWGLLNSTVEPSTTAQPAAADRTWAVTVFSKAGDALTETRPGGVTVTRAFDLLGRMTSEAGTGTGLTAASRTFDYDLGGRTTKIGTGGSTIQALTYFDTGQLKTSTGAAGVSSFAIDATGRLASRTDVAGTTAFEWTNRNELSKYTIGANAAVTLGWKPTGELDNVTYPNAKRTFGYDDLGRVTNDLLATPTAAVLAQRQYTYNPDSSVKTATITQTGNTGAGAYAYTYDAASRLTASTGPGAATYEYDASGNRTKVNGQPYSYDERNRLTAGGGTTYAWSPRGTLNSTTTGTTVSTYTFDALDRLTTTAGNTYTYDSLDRVLTRKQGTAAAVNWNYAGTETDLAFDGTTKYHRSPTGRILASTTATAMRHLGTDRHGDVTWGLNTAGTIDGTRTVDPFGKLINTTGTTSTLGYQGDYTDPTNGLVWMAARWYNPTTATFITRDTYAGQIGAYATRNRYTYALNNPLQYTDPTGHFACYDQECRNTTVSVRQDTNDINHEIKNRDSFTKPVIEIAKSLLAAKIPLKLILPDEKIQAVFTDKRWGKDLAHWVDAILAGTLDGKDNRGLIFESGGLERTALLLAYAFAARYQRIERFHLNGRITTGETDRSTAQIRVDIGGSNRNPQALLQKKLDFYYTQRFRSRMEAFATAAAMGHGGGGSGPSGAAPEGVEAEVAVAEAEGEAGVVAKPGTKATKPGAGAVDDVVRTCFRSFGGETRVLMADGSTKPISEIEVGDEVIAQDPVSGERGTRRVSRLWVHDDDLVRLEIDGDVVRTTEDHPFWNDTDKQWQRADELGSGDLVLTADGRRVKVGVLMGSAGRGLAYNLTVEGLHTYHVLFGSDAVLVHNVCGEDLVSDILKGKKGSIRQAPLPEGAPAWDDVLGMSYAEIEAAAKANTPGFKTIKKLLTDKRFNK